MKIAEQIIAGIILLFMPFWMKAQCADSLRTLSYDTIVTGSGNSFHTLTFPKFNPTLGTLLEVRINPIVTLNYQFHLENKETIPINNYRVRVVREDEVTSSSLLQPIVNNYLKTYGPYQLSAADGNAGSGTDYRAEGPMYVMDHVELNQVVTNTADYLGTGTVDFDYFGATYSIVFGSVNYNYNGTAQDTLHFSLTYVYCSTFLLAADLSYFTAKKSADKKINISWTNLSEQLNRYYILEKSSDGKNFSPVQRYTSFISTAAGTKYNHSYSIMAGDNRKIVFRVKQVDSDGNIKYSQIRIVDIDSKDSDAGIQIYPNPSNGKFNILLNKSKRSDWKIDVMNSSGQIVNTLFFNNSIIARLDLGLPKGFYFIKVQDRKNNENFVEQLVIR